MVRNIQNQTSWPSKAKFLAYLIADDGDQLPRLVHGPNQTAAFVLGAYSPLRKLCV